MKLTAMQVSRETTLSPFDAFRYLKGGLREDLIIALHDYAAANAVHVSVLIDEIFSYDPVDGYQLRPQFRLDEKLLLEGQPTGEPIGILPRGISRVEDS